MAKMIEIRNVSDALHRKLKARAANERMSLSDYLLAEISRSAERPTLGELRARLRKRSPATSSVKGEEIIRSDIYIEYWDAKLV